MKLVKSIILLIMASAPVYGCVKGQDAPPPVAGGTTPVEEPDVEEPEYPEDVYVLTVERCVENYKESFNNDPYYPVSVQYSSSVPVSWKTAKARIVPYLIGFDYETTREQYAASTNKYGSRTDIGQQEATGRFYVKKIGGPLVFYRSGRISSSSKRSGIFA